MFVPLTLRMLDSAPLGLDDHLEFDGQSVEDVIIVGRITEIFHLDMRIDIEISDNTSTNKVVFYQKGTNETPAALKNFEEKQNIYVKVYGTIRVFKGDRKIVGSKIETIKDHNEITNHFLQVFVS